MTNADLDVLAVGIFRTMDDLPPTALRTLSTGLELADGPAHWFAQPVAYFARDREACCWDPDPLSRIAMKSALSKSASEGTLVGRLSEADTAFWAAVGDAVAAVAVDRLPARA